MCRLLPRIATRRTLANRALGIVVCCLLAVSCGGLVMADSGGHQTLRYNKTRRPPIDVVVDDTWSSGEGYRPIRIRVMPVGRPGFMMDRRITLQVFNRSLRNEFSGDETAVEIDLPKGASEVELLLLFQQNRLANSARLEIWEGRRTLTNVLRGRIMRNGASHYTEGVPSVLIIDGDLPSLDDRANRIGRFRGENEDAIANPIAFVRSMPAMMQSAPRGGSDFGDSWVDIAEHISAVTMMHPADLSDQWLVYSGLDIVYVSVDDLQKLIAENPGAWQAVERWVRTGGTLWIAGAGERYDRASEIESMLGFQASDPSMNRWTEPGKATFGDEVAGLVSGQNRRWVNGKYVDDDDLGEPPKFEDRDAKMAFRDLQLGRVAMFKSDRPLEEKDRWYWNWILRSLDTNRWNWSERHGFSPLRYNDGFWQYLIPGVGLAPVNSFRIIITLFALIVGPLNYTFLNRRGRLNWMLFTVPAAALAVTLGLVGYALLTDGVSAKSRIRSVMDVDQVKGHAAIWARQTYYAGVAPAEGLMFGAQTAVYPVDHDGAARTHMGGTSRRTVWVNDENPSRGQHLESGFLTSRTTSQLLTIQSEPTKLRLEMQRGANGQLLSAKNLLGSSSELVIVRDHDGELYTSPGGPSGEVVEFAQASNQEVIQTIDPFLDDLRLELPAGVDLNLLGRSQNRWRWNYNNNVADPNSETSRLEKVIDEFMYRSQVIPPGTFLAIVENNVQLQTGVRSKRRNHEIHLVRGHF